MVTSINIEIIDTASKKINIKETEELYFYLKNLNNEFEVNFSNQRSSSSLSRGDITTPSIIVTLITSGIINTLILLLRDWSLKRKENIKIKITNQEKSIEIEFSPAATSDKDILKTVEKIQKLLSSK